MLVAERTQTDEKQAGRTKRFEGCGVNRITSYYFQYEVVYSSLRIDICCPSEICRIFYRLKIFERFQYHCYSAWNRS